MKYNNLRSKYISAIEKLKSTKGLIFILPLVIAISIVFGIYLGNHFTTHKVGDNDRKLNTILNLIADEYVDTMKLNDLVEMSIPQILANLDPHSVYIPARELQSVNDDLEGSFSGIGVSFVIMNDTINVVEIISGGPAEKVGLMPGDRIVSINDTTFVGKKVTNDAAMSHLKGPKGTVVKLGIKRNNSRSLLTFNVKRGDIPVNSIDAAYMVDNLTGYIKVNKFGKTTYDEFLNALAKLKNSGAKRYMIDLRGNGGGYMEMAILMANEFLPEGQLIVQTKGREKKNDSQVWSDGNGSFQDAEFAVLVDEYSASSSEIFAGAIQDNDRGLIVGRRTFGKGLVQKQFTLPDSSAIRLTIARYYTPSGRCIQKDYKKGLENYDEDIVDRYTHGELYNRDSIKVDKSKVYETVHGRKVYGGGGIIPDIFVPTDTTGMTSYYINVFNGGLLQQFAFRYVGINRATFNKLKDYKQLLRIMPSNDELLNDFVAFAGQNGIPARWYYIDMSRDLIVTQLKALIARDIFGNDAFYPIFNRNDKTIQIALKALDNHKAAFPITDEGE
jgi:carboxyl-terminal processing protease